MFLKDWRDDLRRKNSFLCNFLFESLAEYFKVPYEDIGYLALEEIRKSLIDDSFDKLVIKSRKSRPFAVLVEKGKFRIMSPVPLRYKKAAARAEKLGQRSGQVKGIIAQTGVVKGAVRIIHTFHDVKKIEKGEILVANTTHPDYLFGMKKAAAFVTDEGGIASHAAIVSREMSVPCVVGTKTATRIFKDGDMVEVDATKGIVKKI